MPSGVRLIVLHCTKVKDTSVVIHTLSREYGRRSFLVSVGRGGGKMSLFLPLNILDAEISESSRSSLWRARDLVAVYPLSGIRSDVRKNSMTLFLSEVLYRTVVEGAYEEGLVDWCAKSILSLDALESDFANFHLRFLLELCGALGFAPSATDMAPFAGNRLSDIAFLMERPLPEAMLLPLTGSRRTEIAGILLRYLSFHTESSINVQSLKVLHSLFEGGE